MRRVGACPRPFLFVIANEARQSLGLGGTAHIAVVRLSVIKLSKINTKMEQSLTLI